MAINIHVVRGERSTWAEEIERQAEMAQRNAAEYAQESREQWRRIRRGLLWAALIELAAAAVMAGAWWVVRHWGWM